jgi:hypothetical protein
MAMELVFGLGAIVLGLAIAWSVIRNRRRNPANDAVTEAATRAEYKRPESYDPKQFQPFVQPKPK